MIICTIHKGSQIFPILSQINPIPHTGTYVFKTHSNIFLSLCMYLLKFWKRFYLPSFWLHALPILISRFYLSGHI